MQNFQSFLPNFSVHRMGNAIYSPRVLLPALCPGDIPQANVSPEESFRKSHHSHSLSTAPNMKLHLPKQLFTALLAAITLATPAALTLGSAAWGAEVEISNQQLTWDANTDFTNYVDQQLRMTNGTTITMSGGDRSIEWLRVHDYYSETTETFTLSGGTLNVTYADDGNSDSSGGAAVVLGHWNSIMAPGFETLH